MRDTYVVTRAESVRDRIVHQAEGLGFGAHGLHVLIGDDEAQHLWSPDVRRDIQSVAKGVCVLAAGIASDEGLLDFDHPVAGILGVSPLGDGAEEVTLRHLLTMTSGIDLPWSETMLTDWPDLAAEFLARPTTGRSFQYSNASTYTAMRVLEAVAGDVASYLEARLLVPLGLTDVAWDRCPLGHIAAGGGLWLRTSELARLGRLIRDGGRWGGRVLVSRRWIDEMHTDWVATGSGPSYDGYALAGWKGPGEAWRLHGAYGQLVIFLDDAVVTVMADDHDGADAMSKAIVAALA